MLGLCGVKVLLASDVDDGEALRYNQRRRNHDSAVGLWAGARSELSRQGMVEAGYSAGGGWLFEKDPEQ